MAKVKNRFDLLESLGEFPLLQPTKRPRLNVEKTLACQEVYMIVKSTEEGKKLTNLSIFGVQKGLELITKHIKKVSPQRNGDLLILTSTKAAATSLKKAKTLGGLCSIDCVEHPFLNSSRAKIYCPSLMNLDEGEITEGLKDEGVVASRIIKKWKDGVLINTPLVILTFNTPVIPENIKVGYLSIRTELYIPNPLRCTMCQKFGHGKKRCAELNELPTCGLCATLLTPEDQSHQKCTKTPKCVNCGEGHGSFSRDCKIFKAELEITRIKTVNRVSYRMARQKYAELTRIQKPNNTKEAAGEVLSAAAAVAASTAAVAEPTKKSVSSDSLSTKITPLTKTNNTETKKSPIKQTKTNTAINKQNNITTTQNNPNITQNITNTQQVNTNIINTQKLNQPSSPSSSNPINTPIISTQNPFQQDSKKRDASQLTRLSENERALYATYTPME